jgi:hypothetical protein
MENKFTIKLNVDSFLGMQISRNRKCQTISLSQLGYITNLMSRFNMNISNLIHYPKCPMTTDMSDPTPVPLIPSQQTIFMQLVGSVPTKATPTTITLTILKYVWITKHLCLNYNEVNAVGFGT